MLTVKTKYAIKAIACLARQGERGATLSAEIAERESIPKKFLDCILLELKNDGLLISKRGKNGGYALAAKPESIKIKRVIDLLDGPLNPAFCSKNGERASCASCESASGCALRLALSALSDAIGKALDELTVDELIKRGNAESVFI